jgi:hypothetical protein
LELSERGPTNSDYHNIQAAGIHKQQSQQKVHIHKEQTREHGEKDREKERKADFSPSRATAD